MEPDLAGRLEEMASLRNRLVHGYVDRDPRRVLAIATDDVGDLADFVTAIVRRFGLADSP